MAAALLTMAVTLAAVPLTRRLWLLTAVSLLLGLAESVLDVGGNTLLVWALGARVAPYMNALHFAFGVGAFLSPLVVERAVTATGGIAWAYWSLALLVLPVAAVVLRLSPPAAAAGVADGRAAPVDRRLVGLVAVFFFLYCGAEVSFGGWIFTYAVALGMGDETTGAYLTSAFWGAFTLGRLLAIPIATRASARSVILADLVGCLISVGIVLGWSGSSAALWIGTIGSGLSMASIFPTTLSLAERRLQITGRVTGWFFVGVSIGGMFLPWLIGQLFESIGPRVLMIALTVDLAAALGIFAVLLRAPARPARVA